MAPARQGGGWVTGASAQHAFAYVIAKLSDLATGFVSFQTAYLLPVRGSGGRNKSIGSLDKNAFLHTSQSCLYKNHFIAVDATLVSCLSFCEGQGKRQINSQ